LNIKPAGGTITDFIVINNGRAFAMFRKSCWEQVGGYDEQMLVGYEDWNLVPIAKMIIHATLFLVFFISLSQLRKAQRPNGTN
jgi:hypothetical protein